MFEPGPAEVFRDVAAGDCPLGGCVVCSSEGALTYTLLIGFLLTSGMGIQTFHSLPDNPRRL